MRIDPIESFWERFAEAEGVTDDYEAWAFGGEDDADLADELAYLVLHGPKRATTSLYEETIADGDLPRVGGYSVIVDGTGNPRCIIRTTEVDVVPFGEVDDRYAWDEGEGDRSLAFWRQAHIDFFGDSGHDITDETLVVLERFDLVWPRPGEELPQAEPGDPASDFFAGYRDALNKADLDAIVAAHATPSYLVKEGRVIRHLDEQAKAEYFAAMLAARQAEGEHRWEISDIVFEYPADNSALVLVRWTCVRPDGSLLAKLDNTYVLAEEEGVWRILGDLAHE